MQNMTQNKSKDAKGRDVEEEMSLYWFKENTFHPCFKRNYKSDSVPGRPAQAPLYWYLVLLWMANKGELISVNMPNATFMKMNLLGMAFAGAQEMLEEWKEWCGKPHTVKDLKDVYIRARDDKDVEKNFLLQNCVEMRQWVDNCICKLLQYV